MNITIDGARQTLLLEIARCSALAHAERGDGPCASVAAVQVNAGTCGRQVPEPWSGSLEASILFISTNPSIDDRPGDWAEDYPTASSSDEDLLRFFNERFDGERPPVKSGRYGRLKNGEYGRATPFWSSVRMRAKELLGREPLPGHDYALTEIVHCKSRSEMGVAEATDACVRRYLERILDLSEARVLVVLGSHAGKVLREHFQLEHEADHYPPSPSHSCHVCFLPHPNARGVKKSFDRAVIDSVRPVFGPTIDALLALSPFVHEFTAEGFTAGIFHNAEEIEPGVFSMPWWEPSDIVLQWEAALYHHGIIDPQSDYLSEEFGRQVEEFAADPTLLSAADLPTIRTVLTNISRGERFCDGYMASMLESGVAQAATARLVQLADGRRASLNGQ